MKAVRGWLKRRLHAYLYRRSVDPRAQARFAKAVDYLQYLMGIGAGDDVETSGEAALIALLRRQPADHQRVVFDVGANQGQFLSLLLGGLAGLPLEVHAFEPGAQAFNRLQAQYGDHPAVHLNREALGSRPGEAVLHADRPGSGLASLYPRRLEHFGLALDHDEAVPVETLDRYCQTHGVAAIDLLKVDVEGHELEVLRGASQLFANHSIRWVSFEFGGAHIDARVYFQDFYYFFKEAGMGEIYRLAPSGVFFPLGGYRESYEQFRTTNFLVAREGETPR